MPWPRGRACPAEKRRAASQAQRGRIRRRDLLPAAVELYRRHSVRETARQLQAHHETVRRVLVAAGVRIRTAEETWQVKRRGREL